MDPVAFDEFEEVIRQKLPALLRQRGDFRYEVLGILADVFATKDDLKTVLDEIKKLREDGQARFEAMDRRFEAMDRRFEAMDRRFEAMEKRFDAADRRFEAMDKRFEALVAELKELREDTNRRFEAADRRFEELALGLRELRLEVSALSGRLGKGLEEVIRQTLERFSGHTFNEVKRLVLKDKEGELYGVPSEVEFDLYLSDSVSYVVEVKSHAKSGDVMHFYKKKLFAEKKLGKPLGAVIIASSADRVARKKCKELGIDLLARSIA